MQLSYMSIAVDTTMAASAPASPRLEAALSAAALLDPSISLLATHAAQLLQQWLLRFSAIAVALCNNNRLSGTAHPAELLNAVIVAAEATCPAQRSTAAEPATTMLYVASSFCLFAY